MTEETMSVPTTGAEFDDAMETALADIDSTIDDPEDVLTDGIQDYEGPFEDDEFDSTDELFDLHSFDLDEDISSDDYEYNDFEEQNLSENISDVAEFIQSGDTESALRRLGEYGRGVEKLQAQRTEAIESVDNLRGLFEEVALGDQTAIETLDQVLASHGTSIESLYSHRHGQAPFLQSTEGGFGQYSQEPARLSYLEAEVAALRQDRADSAWVMEHGPRVCQAIEEQIGLRFTPQLIARVRHSLPTQASVEDIEDAVMRADPRAYRTAQANRLAQPAAPSSAMVSRGGKGAAKADPLSILADPRKYEAYLKG